MYIDLRIFVHSIELLLDCIRKQKLFKTHKLPFTLLFHCFVCFFLWYYLGLVLAPAIIPAGASGKYCIGIDVL